MKQNANLLTVKQPQISDVVSAFELLSKKAKGYLNDKAQTDHSFCKKASPFEVERITEQAFKEVCFEPFVASDIRLVSGHTFPDIIAGKNFGIEVKTSTTGGWKSTGSSIIESTRSEDIKKVYMLFANLSGELAQFECKPYEQCLSGIAVTQSPRYTIDMNVEETIFDKINVSYDAFRKMSETDKISKVRQYYIEKSRREHRLEMPWWMGDSTNINISIYNDKDTKTKDSIMKQIYILFPETLNGDTADGYKKASLWLCNRYSLLCYNMRDVFSAGGKLTTINGKRIPKPYPAVVKRLLKYREDIESILKHPTSTLLSDIKEIWNQQINVDKLYETWLDKVEKQFVSSGIDIRKHLENHDTE